MSCTKRIAAGLAALSLCLVLAGCTGASAASASAGSAAQSAAGTEPKLADTATLLNYNSLTGEALAEGVAAGTRPVAVLVNNAQAALPQRGITAADAIVEMLTENGNTRLMALYANPAAMPQVGPVYSVRDQQLQFALPLNAIVAHIGGNVYTSNLLNAYSYQDIDGRYLGTMAFMLDEARHATYQLLNCWYTDPAHIAAAEAEMSIPTTGNAHALFHFAKSKVTLPGEDVATVDFSFSDAAAVQLTYQPETGLYAKAAFGAPHTDESGAQLSFTNAVLLFAEIGLKADGITPDFNLTQGKGIYLTGGKAQHILWKKGEAQMPLTLTDENGKQIAINTGKSYLAVVGTDRIPTVMLNGSAAFAPAAESTATQG